jgi:DNA-binding GntR family transcriptional regulator
LPSVESGESGYAPDRGLSGSAKLAVYRSLKTDIVKGLFDMGERLSEGKLAAKYRVSKTPVREALSLLQQEGLVEVQPRVGYLTSRVTLQDVDDIFDLRRVVEAVTAERAATAMTEEALVRLEQLQSSFRPGDRESYLTFLEENQEFHCTIAHASGNRRLVEIVSRVLEQMQRLIILKLDLSFSGDELLEQHHLILTALRQRDPEAARRAMIADLDSTNRAILDALRKRMANWHI